MVDSGIAPGHVHVGAVAGGITIAGEGEPVDRLGHGTAVAGAIRQWAVLDERAHLFQSRVAADRARAFANEFHPVVVGGVVAGGDHDAAVEAMGERGEVASLRPA